MSEENNRELEEIKRKLIEELTRRRAKIAEASTNSPVEVTDLNFDDVVKSHSLVVIDCWAPWCPPCRMMAPIVDELSREYAGKILFGKLNVDKNPRTPAKYQIMSIPTFLIFKNGILVDKIIGAMAKKTLEHRITKYMET